MPRRRCYHLDEMYSDEDILEFATKVGEHLKASGRKVVTAESCSGGWISKALTDVPGSSEWFEFGFITYSDLAKRDLLGITPALESTTGIR